MVMVRGDDNGAYILLGHGLDPLPAVGDFGVIEFVEQDHPPFGYWHYTKSKCCPFDNTPLINVGPMAVFEDKKDNYICPRCHRIWIDVYTEEWQTRMTRAHITGELKEGVNYGDVVKIIL